MGLVTEEVRHETVDVTIMTVERQKGEVVEPWRFISVEFDVMERMTPKELRQLGRWLMTHGRRIGREYKSNGAKKSAEAVRG